MTLEEKIEMLEEIMDLEAGDLELEQELSEIEEWDSLSALSLIVEMKKRFRMELTTEIINTFKIVKDICDYIPD